MTGLTDNPTYERMKGECLYYACLCVRVCLFVCVCVCVFVRVCLCVCV